MKLQFYTMILTYIIATILITLVLAIIQQKSGLSFEKIVFPQFAPAIAVLLVFYIYNQLPVSINYQINKDVLIKAIVALLFPIVIFSIVYFVGNQIGSLMVLNENIKKVILLSIPGMLIGAFAEEIGWRSFLLPILDEKYSNYIAAILTGIIWGLWHFGHFKNGLIFMVGFLLFTIAASILLSLLLSGTQYNLLLSGIFHFAINFGFAFFFSKALSDSKLMFINGIIWCVFTGGIALLIEKKLLHL